MREGLVCASRTDTDPRTDIHHRSTAVGYHAAISSCHTAISGRLSYEYSRLSAWSSRSAHPFARARDCETSQTAIRFVPRSDPRMAWSERVPSFLVSVVSRRTERICPVRFPTARCNSRHAPQSQSASDDGKDDDGVQANLQYAAHRRST